MKANVYSLDGNVVKQIELPELFEATYREDLIRRAVLSDESKDYQPKGCYKFAGLETSARYRGRKDDYGTIKNRGISRLPREVLPEGQFGKVRRVPHAVKGRRAHPPKPEKKLIERMNQKEYKKALISALAASTHRDLVKRYCELPSDISIPIVVSNEFENLKKTKEVLKFFDSMKLKLADKKSKNVKKAVIIASGTVLKAARNLPAINAVSPEELKVKHLAPGTYAGRLLILSENGLARIVERLAE